MDIKIIALTLLTARIVSVVFLLSVLRKQWAVLRTKDHPELGTLRRVLFYLSMVIFLGQFVPILIDAATLVAQVKRSDPNPLGVAYAYSNAFTAMISSLLLWFVYRLAAVSNR
jgi:hypothetical protein